EPQMGAGHHPPSGVGFPNQQATGNLAKARGDDADLSQRPSLGEDAPETPKSLADSSPRPPTPSLLPLSPNTGVSSRVNGRGLARNLLWIRTSRIPCGIFQRSIHKMLNDSRARKPNRTACFARKTGGPNFSVHGAGRSKEPSRPWGGRVPASIVAAPILSEA